MERGLHEALRTSSMLSGIEKVHGGSLHEAYQALLDFVASVSVHPKSP